MKRFLAIFKDLQDSGQLVTIIGHFTLQLGQIQDVTEIDHVHISSKIADSATCEVKNPNRYTTEHGRNGEGDLLPFSSAVVPPDLAEVIDAWHKIPDSIKTGIMAMVKTFSG